MAEDDFEEGARLFETGQISRRRFLTRLVAGGATVTAAYALLNATGPAAFAHSGHRRPVRYGRPPRHYGKPGHYGAAGQYGCAPVHYGTPPKHYGNPPRHYGTPPGHYGKPPRNKWQPVGGRRRR